MQYSPKLKKAMDEIKAVLKKHDIAGTVIIHTPGYSEYLNHINTSYSCAYMEGDQLRVRARLKEDFNGNKEEQRKKIEDTINMITHFSDIGGQLALGYFEMKEMILKKVDFDQDDGNHTSHIQQNN